MPYPGVNLLNLNYKKKNPHKKGGLDKFGNLSPVQHNGSRPGFRQPGTIRSAHGQKLNAELKQLRNRKSRYREEKPVHYISPEEADKYKEFLEGSAPEREQLP